VRHPESKVFPAFLVAAGLIATPLALATTGDGDDDDAPSLSLQRFVLATDVEERQPVEPTDEFSRTEDTKIVAFLEVANPTRTATQVVVHWARPDGVDRFSPTTIDIPAYRRWRTWARTTPQRIGTGTHVCIVKGPDGRELGRKRFEVVD